MAGSATGRARGDMADPPVDVGWPPTGTGGWHGSGGLEPVYVPMRCRVGFRRVAFVTGGVTVPPSPPLPLAESITLPNAVRAYRGRLSIPPQVNAEVMACRPGTRLG